MPCYLPSVYADENLAANTSLSDPCIGQELTADDEEALRCASACMRAEKISLRLIARAEQTPMGLARKLEKRGHTKACIQQVLERLTELKLVDEGRFVRLWLESRLARRADSPRQLLACLCNRGIDRGYAQTGITAALDSETEVALLRRYVKKFEKKKNFRKIISGNHADPQRSLKYHLKGQGFSSAAIEMYMNSQ